MSMSDEGARELYNASIDPDAHNLLIRAWSELRPDEQEHWRKIALSRMSDEGARERMRLALSRIERDVRVSELTDDEIASLAAALSRSPTVSEQDRDGVERFYIDCEFDGHGGPLLSIAIVREDGDGIHITADVAAMDLWVIQNVMPRMDRHNAPKSAKVYLNEVGGVIRAFIGDCRHPIIIADSPVDIGRFCAAISTGSDGGWASADYPSMTFEVHNVDCYPTDLPGAVQHNAWWDAMALRHKLATLPPVAVAAGQGERLREALEAELHAMRSNVFSVLRREKIGEDAFAAIAAETYAPIRALNGALAPSPLYTCLDDLRDYIARTHGKDHPLVEKAGKVMGL